MRSLGVQQLLTSPYHPEGNSINERSHRTINNMLRARLLDGASSRSWVEKIPGIMLALNAMVHEPHGFSASMIATGREPTLPPDLENGACASPSLNDPASYIEALRQRLSLTHQQMTPPPAPAATNPYEEGSLIFVLTTPPERTNKLAPRWKGPFRAGPSKLFSLRATLEKTKSHAGYLCACMYMCCSFFFLFFLSEIFLYICISVYIPRHFNDTLVMKTCMSITFISFVHKIILIPKKKKKKKKTRRKL